MARSKLNKGEIAGIRLFADYFVVRGLLDNVYNEHLTAKQVKDLEAHLKKKVPKIFAAEKELQKQVQAVRKIWLEELEKELPND